MELFQTEPTASQPDSHPLASRLAPRDWDEFVGQEHLVQPDRPLRKLIDTDQLKSSIFFGPSGSGKTALARLAARKSKAAVEYVNAVTAGVADIRQIVKRALERKKLNNQRTLLIVDEIHHFNRSQQDALLPDVERGNLILVGLTTENPYFYVNSALMSRSTAFEFKALSDEALNGILTRALQDSRTLASHQPMRIHDDARTHLIQSSNGDARRLLNHIELAVLATAAAGPGPTGPGPTTIDLKMAEESSQKRSVRYDKHGDEHYDTISAFIKSLRGSHPDAALYWMAKMIKAGEDPRFIARRMVIFASEDIGNADPQALGLAVAVADAVERIGMPEARIILGQGATYLASAPKSNASYTGINQALDEVENGPVREVPHHLKDANLDRKTRGHGEGYQYPHDFPGHFVEQEYMPQPKEFYTPSDQGYEAEIKNRLETWRPKKSS